MDRTARARAVVDAYIDRRATGTAVSELQLINAHRDLMPELGEQLDLLRLIDRASSRAQGAPDATMFEDSGDEGAPLGSAASGPPPDSFDGYELINPVHRGGQGVVFRARQKATCRDVAIKVAREGPFAGPHDRARFDREVRILATLNHPNIVTVHDSGTAAGHFFFVMDFIDGEPLDAYVASRKLPIEERLLLLEKICDAVNAAHLRGVIHRDLKPGNVLIDAEGEPNILDFGLAKMTRAEGEGAAPTMTAPGQFVGSLPWAAPEQVEGLPEQIDLRTDVYSLGVMLYHVLTGRFPYTVVGNLRDVFEQISRGEPTRPSTLDRRIDGEIETIVLKCLSKEPERRYQSAGALAEDLKRYRTGRPIDAKRDSTWYVVRKTVRRHKAPALVAVLFVLLVAGFGVGMSAMYHRAAREAEQHRRLADRLQALFQFKRADLEGGQFSVVDMLDRHAESSIRELEDLPEAQARLIEATSRAYMVFRRADRALPWLRELARLHREVLGSDERTLAPYLLQLANALTHTGRHDEARRCFDEAIARLRQSTPEPDRMLASALRSYGDFIGYRMGDLQAGLAHRKESLAILRTLEPPDEHGLGEAVSAMGGYLHDMARFEEAERYYREALALHVRLGDESEARGNRLWLGLLYKDMGRYDEAEVLLRAVTEEFEAIYGVEDQAMAFPYLSLAKLYADATRPEEALVRCRSAIRLYVDQYGEDHEVTSEPMTLKGRILIQQKRYEEAERALRKAFKTREAVFPRANWERAKTATLLGAALAGLGRFEEAEPLLLENYPFIRENRGPCHRRTREAIERIIDYYNARDAAEPGHGYAETAAEWRAELVEGSASKIPPNTDKETS